MKGDVIIQLDHAEIYQEENLVLHDVNLSVEEGEFVYVIGRVGTGKSSLIKTLNAELPLISGEGSVAGYSLKNIRTRDIPYLRRKLGVVFQDFRLLPDRSVRANLEFVLRATGWKKDKAITERIILALSMVGMERSLNKMPHQLSGGEQQRVVIARALLNDPPVILADEPTGNLDPETSEQILSLLIELNQGGKTILMASHDYALISRHRARTLICEKYSLVDASTSSGNLDFDEILAEK
ncbi:MAG: cell division ATP-binding protein FtsE [Bacteroidota bacterium]